MNSIKPSRWLIVFILLVLGGFGALVGVLVVHPEAPAITEPVRARLESVGSSVYVGDWEVQLLELHSVTTQTGEAVFYVTGETSNVSAREGDNVTFAKGNLNLHLTGAHWVWNPETGRQDKPLVDFEITDMRKDILATVVQYEAPALACISLISLLVTLLHPTSFWKANSSKSQP
jgi:hypothetical protein